VNRLLRWISYFLRLSLHLALLPLSSPPPSSQRRGREARLRPRAAPARRARLQDRRRARRRRASTRRCAFLSSRRAGRRIGRPSRGGGRRFSSCEFGVVPLSCDSVPFFVCASFPSPYVTRTEAEGAVPATLELGPDVGEGDVALDVSVC